MLTVTQLCRLAIAAVMFSALVGTKHLRPAILLQDRAVWTATEKTRNNIAPDLRLKPLPPSHGPNFQVAEANDLEAIQLFLVPNFMRAAPFRH